MYISNLVRKLHRIKDRVATTDANVSCEVLSVVYICIYQRMAYQSEQF